MEKYTSLYEWVHRETCCMQLQKEFIMILSFSIDCYIIISTKLYEQKRIMNNYVSALTL